RALVGLGEPALGALGQEIADPRFTREGTGSAAWVMAQFPSELREAVHGELANGIQAAMARLEDPELLAEEKEDAKAKIGSLVWAAGVRPPEEHDAIGGILVEDL